MSENHGYESTDAEFVATLKSEVDVFYRRLFGLGTGSRFHAFVEWCGVMGEHLKIVEDLIDQGHDPFEMNRHTGETLPVAPYRLSYMAEKMECIFDGTMVVRARMDDACMATFEERLSTSISEIVERRTKSSHHHATRKAMVRDLVAAAMRELDAGLDLQGHKERS